MPKFIKVRPAEWNHKERYDVIDLIAALDSDPRIHDGPAQPPMEETCRAWPYAYDNTQQNYRREESRTARESILHPIKYQRFFRNRWNTGPRVPAKEYVWLVEKKCDQCRQSQERPRSAKDTHPG